MNLKPEEDGFGSFPVRSQEGDPQGVSENYHQLRGEAVGHLDSPRWPGGLTHTGHIQDPVPVNIFPQTHTQ